MRPCAICGAYDPQKSLHCQQQSCCDEVMCLGCMLQARCHRTQAYQSTGQHAAIESTANTRACWLQCNAPRMAHHGQDAVQLSLPRHSRLPPHHMHPLPRIRLSPQDCVRSVLHHNLYTCSTPLLQIAYTATSTMPGCHSCCTVRVCAHKAVWLQFDYRERAHAVGKMPRSRTQKEFSHSDREVAVSALMDRAFRPLFPPGFSRFCQVRPGSALLPAQLGGTHLGHHAAVAPRVQPLLPGEPYLCGPDGRGSSQPSILPFKLILGTHVSCPHSSAPARCCLFPAAASSPCGRSALRELACKPLFSQGAAASAGQALLAASAAVSCRLQQPLVGHLAASSW